MNIKLNYSLILLLSSVMILGELRALSELDMETEESEDAVRGRKCKKFRNVSICNLKADNVVITGNATVEGDLTVDGLSVAASLRAGAPVSAQSFGVRNYGVFLSSFGLSGDNYVTWGDTPASNVSADITLDTNTGFITLPTGIFMVQYTVRFNLPASSSGTGSPQIFQGPAGGPLTIALPNMNISATNGASDFSQPLATAYAFITVTSAADNTIGLNILTFNGMLFTGGQAEETAEMTILQLN